MQIDDELAELGPAAHRSELMSKTHTGSKDRGVRRRVRHAGTACDSEAINRSKKCAVDTVNGGDQFVENDRERRCRCRRAILWCGCGAAGLTNGESSGLQ